MPAAASHQRAQVSALAAEDLRSARSGAAAPPWRRRSARSRRPGFPRPARMSGRRSSNVDGKPVGGIGGTGSCARSPGGSLRSSLPVSVPSRCSASARCRTRSFSWAAASERAPSACARSRPEARPPSTRRRTTPRYSSRVASVSRVAVTWASSERSREIRLRRQARQRQRDDVLRIVRRQDLRPRTFEQPAQPSPEIDLERRRQRDAQVVAGADRRPATLRLRSSASARRCRRDRSRETAPHWPRADRRRTPRSSPPQRRRRGCPPAPSRPARRGCGSSYSVHQSARIAVAVVVAPAAAGAPA